MEKFVGDFYIKTERSITKTPYFKEFGVLHVRLENSRSESGLEKIVILVFSSFSASKKKDKVWTFRNGHVYSHKGRDCEQRLNNGDLVEDVKINGKLIKQILIKKDDEGFSRIVQNFAKETFSIYKWKKVDGLSGDGSCILLAGNSDLEISVRKTTLFR